MRRSWRHPASRRVAHGSCAHKADTGPLTGHHSVVAFYLAVGGLFALWIGGGNLVARRLAARRWGPLGSEQAIWTRRGLFFAPNWLSIPIVGLGGVLVEVMRDVTFRLAPVTRDEARSMFDWWLVIVRPLIVRLAPWVTVTGLVPLSTCVPTVRPGLNVGVADGDGEGDDVPEVPLEVGADVVGAGVGRPPPEVPPSVSA